MPVLPHMHMHVVNVVHIMRQPWGSRQLLHRCSNDQHPISTAAAHQQQHISTSPGSCCPRC
jgi:hypothetical protein